MNRQLISKLTSKQRLHGCNIPILGLTGGIASGKTTVANMLKDLGIEVINADELVKEIYSTQEAIGFIQKVAPECVINHDINFPSLRQQVFDDESLQEKIETFIYARLPKKFLERAANSPWVVYDVPLLFEKELNEMVDSILLIATKREIQKQRLIERDNSTEQLADKILDLQWPLEDKKKMSDYIIENNSNLESLKESLDLFISSDDYFTS